MGGAVVFEESDLLSDVPLPLNLTYQEWYALFFDVLKADKSGYDAWVNENPIAARNTILIGLSEEIPDYPMLSRIEGPRNDAVFEAGEVEQLRQECLVYR